MLNRRITLRSRLTSVFAGFTLIAFLLFAAVTVFTLYALEDAVFNQQLAHAEQRYLQGAPLPDNVKLLDEQQENHGLQIKQFAGDRGELSIDGRNVHYKRIESASAPRFLVLDATEQLFVGRAIDDVLLLFSPVLIILLLLALLLSFWCTNLALKPFNQLVQLFQRNRLDVTQQNASEAIRENDVRMLADTLRQEMRLRDALAAEKEAFNRGISHELRTPLQIIHHSSELLLAKQPELATAPPVTRMQKAVRRMQRTSEAFLWLTKPDDYEHATAVQPILSEMVAELTPLLQANEVRVSINEQGQPRLKVPACVCEVILYNLLSNAAQHSPGEALDISLSADEIVFENALKQSAEDSQGFNLGLTLIHNLCERFGLGFSTRASQSVFSASIQLPFESDAC